MSEWTAKRIDLMRAMIEDEGLTASQVAKQLSTTRNAVIGKASRLGLKRKKLPPDAKPELPESAISVKPPRTKKVHNQGHDWDAPGVMEEAQRLAGLGHTWTEIAAAIGCSAAAIGNKCRREGIVRTKPIVLKSLNANPTHMTSVPADRRAMGNRSVLQIIDRVEARAAIPTAEIIDLPPHTGLVKLFDLNANHCRWPIGDPSSNDFGFCGRFKEVPDSYCGEHYRIAYGGRAASPLPDLSRLLKTGKVAA